MPDSKDIEYWHKILEQYRANLRKQRKQQATFAKGEERLALLNQIEALEEGIREAKARLRELGVEPEPSTIDPPEEFKPFNDIFIKSYPFPIAWICREFNNAIETVQKFVSLDRLMTNLIKYLAAIFIGQARRDRPDDYPLPMKLNWMDRPTIENWAETIRDLSQIYSKSPCREKFKLGDLMYACTRSLLGKEELIYAVDYLTKRLDKSGIDEPSVIDFLELLAWYREKEWQDMAGLYPIVKVKPLMLRLQPAVVVLLYELQSIRSYPLIYLEHVDDVNNEIHLRTVKFMGQFTEDIQPFNKSALTISQEKGKLFKRRRICIADSEGIPYLDLHPFFILYRWELYVLERHEPSKFIEFSSCIRGNRLRPPPEDRTLYDSWWEMTGYNEDSKDKMEQITPLIFISYAREDGGKALDFYNRLKNVDFKPWIDLEDILPGEAWELKIRQILRQSDFLLICLSEKSVTKRGYIQREIRMAVEIAKEMPEGTIFLIPVRLEECEVPLSLSRYHWVDLFEPDGFDKLIRAIKFEWKKKR